MKQHRLLTGIALSGALAFGVAACGSDDEEPTTTGGASTEQQTDNSKFADAKGEIVIDGSSTVLPFAQRAAESFKRVAPGVNVTVGGSGTGGGFEKFCAGETDISNASRPIKEDEEVPLCEKEGIEFAEFQVANDGVAVAVNPALQVDCLTTAELKKVWKKGSKIKSLADVKDGAPDTELSLFGPGTDSGTFEYFTEEINGEEGNTREDYQASEDDNQLVTGVAGDEGGLGYFGFSYVSDQVKAIGIDSGDGCVTPSNETIQDGSYKPLSRPLFMYPSKKALTDKPQVKAFMEFVEQNYQQIADASKIVPMTEEQAGKSSQALDQLTGA